MYNLGCCYASGTYGVQENFTTALGWFAKGVELDDARCIARAGAMIAQGLGTERQEAYGISLLTRAAMMGSTASAYGLGTWHSQGELGLPIDQKQALFWYRKVATASIDDSVSGMIDEAAAYVREHGV